MSTTIQVKLDTDADTMLGRNVDKRITDAMQGKKKKNMERKYILMLLQVQYM